MTDFDEFLEEQLKDPEFRYEYEALEPEFAIVQAMIDARRKTGLTQKQLSERTGIAQSDISKFETGGGNPSLKTLQRLAVGMGMALHIEFQPSASSLQTLCPSRNTELVHKKDFTLPDEYMDALSSIAEGLSDIEHDLIPAMKTWRGDDDIVFEYYYQLAVLSKRFDRLVAEMHRFLSSATLEGGARAVKARIQRAAAPVETANVLTNLEILEDLILRYYDSLGDQTKARLGGECLQTLELTLHELVQAEHGGVDVGATAALCIRVVDVISRAIFDSLQGQQGWSDRNLEAEVAALERLATMRRMS